MAVNLHLKYWRFGNNGGTESTHTWIGAQNATPPLKLDTTYLLRLGIQQTEATAAANLAQQFQCNPKGLGWQKITTSSTYVKAVTPTTFANNDASTNRLTGLTGSADATNANCTTDGSSGGTANDVPASGFSETVCGIQLLAADGLVAGDTVQFRCTVSGPTTTITYDVTPSALVLGPVLAVTETPTAARAFWPPIEQTISATAEGHAASEYAGSSCRVHCIADLEGHKVETGPSLDYETLGAIETPSAGLQFPPRLDAQWAALDKAQTTYHLPHVAKTLDATEEPTGDLTRQVDVALTLDPVTETPVAAIAKAIFTPQLHATVTPFVEDDRNEIVRVKAFRTQAAEETSAARLTFPPRLDATETPEADLGRAVFASVTLAAEVTTTADSRESGKLDTTVATTATLDATVLAFRQLDATAGSAAGLRAPVKLDATVAPEATLAGRRPGLEETLDAVTVGLAGLMFPPKLDGQATHTGDLARAVLALRTLDAEETPTADLHESKKLEAAAATTADLSIQVLRHLTIDATADSGTGMVYPPKLDAVVTPDATLAEKVPANEETLAAEATTVAGLQFPPRLDAEAATDADASKSALYHILLEAELGGTGGSTPPAPDLHYGTFPFVEGQAHVVGVPPIPRVVPPQRVVAGAFCVSEDSRVEARAYTKTTPQVRVAITARLIVRATAVCESEHSHTFGASKAVVVAKAEAYGEESEVVISGLADDSLRLLGMLT